MTEYIQIPNWKNYFINKEGNIIRKWKNGNTTHLKKYKVKQGYIRYGLTHKSKSKEFLLHRTLAELFIPNPNNLPHVDHINRVRDDYRLENLRWVSRSQNCLNCERTSYILEANDKQKLKNGEIKLYKYFRLWWWIKEDEFLFKRKSKRFKTKEEAEKYKHDHLI